MRTPTEHKGRRVVALETPHEWRDWLEREGATSDSVWLTVWKKAAGPGRLAYDDVVDEALCWGWIDSTVNRLDDMRSLLLLAPRKRGSVWSAINKGRLERLEAEGRIQPSGRAVIERAQQDGSWTILDSVEAMEEPADLVDAIERAGCRARWLELSPGNRKQVLYRLVLAKTEATRQRRIEEALSGLLDPS